MRLKLKVFLAVLLGTLCIGGAVTVFASDSIPMQKVEFNGEYMDIPDVSHEYFIFYDVSANNYFVCFDPTGIKLSNSSDGGYSIYGVWYARFSGGSWQIFDSATNNGCHIAPATEDLYCSTVDLVLDDGTVVFWGPVPLVQSAAVLPETLIPVVQKILPVTIGMMALLIGSMVLLPRLKIFLRL
jgi:hypothetical protein